MAVFRVDKTKNYTVMSNEHLRNKEMSLKAKGLLSLMLSLPDDWDYSLNGLVAICKENESAVKTTLQELKDLGYLEIIKKFPDTTDTGRIEYEYVVYETSKQEGKKQGLENLPLEIQPLENHTQLNTNNKILITNNDNDKAMQFYLKNINPLPVAREVEQIEQYEKELPSELLIYGMEKAVDNKARNLAYIKAIWNKWIQRGITTLAEAQEEKPKVEKQEEPTKQDYRVHADDEIDYNQFYANF